MPVTSVYIPRVSHSHTPPPQETLQDQWVSLVQAPIKLLILPLVPVHVRFCVCPLRVRSLFPPFLWNSFHQAPMVFKAKCSRDSSSWCQNSNLGA